MEPTEEQSRAEFNLSVRREIKRTEKRLATLRDLIKDEPVPGPRPKSPAKTLTETLGLMEDPPVGAEQDESGKVVRCPAVAA